MPLKRGYFLLHQPFHSCDWSTKFPDSFTRSGFAVFTTIKLMPKPNMLNRFAVALSLCALLGAAPEVSLAQNTKPDAQRTQQLNDLLREGRKQVDAKAYDRAIQIYRQAAELDGKNAKIFSGIGYLEAVQGNYQEAAIAYRQAIALDPKNADFYYALGYSLANLGDNEDAIAAYRRSTEMNAKNLNAQYGLGIVLTRVGNHREAEQVYRQVIALQPKSAKGYELLGASLIQQRRFQDAISPLEQAAKLAPREGTIYVQMGAAQLGVGNRQAGLRAFKRAAELEPRNALIQLQIFRVEEQWDDALIAYKRAAILKNDLAEAHLAIGEIHIRRQDYLSAILAYRDYIRIAPNDPTGYYGLGKALASRDRKSEAIENLEKARDLYKQQRKTEEVKQVEKLIKELR